MYEDFKDRTVVVTGAGSNLGRAVALHFAEAGSRLIAVDRDGALAAETCELSKSRQAVSRVVDVQSEAQVSDLAAAVRESHSKVDILVNCAGITQAGRPYLADVEEGLFDRIVAVNVKGVFLTMKHFIPAIIEGGGGSIVNVSSAAGLVGQVGMSIYSASKHAVIGLTKSAALEYGPKGVRINAVCPSRQTGLMMGTPKGAVPEAEVLEADRLKNPASGRAGRPEELAATVLFLCSSGAGNIHGTAIPVDGGFTAM